MMGESILKNKMILAVDNDPDVLTVLEEEILAACSDCQFHKATTYKEAVERMVSLTYDIVLLDIIGIRGVDLAKLAMSRNFPIAILTVHPITPEMLQSYFKMKAHAYLPKERIGEIVPFLEEALKYQYPPEWRLLFDRVIGFFSKRIEIDWGKKPTVPQEESILSEVRPQTY